MGYTTRRMARGHSRDNPKAPFHHDPTNGLMQPPSTDTKPLSRTCRCGLAGDARIASLEGTDVSNSIVARIALPSAAASGQVRFAGSWLQASESIRRSPVLCCHSRALSRAAESFGAHRQGISSPKRVPCCICQLRSWAVRCGTTATAYLCCLTRRRRTDRETGRASDLYHRQDR
jgi:hypothetical protein